jgi:SAM-dependent methyltransferase
VEFAGQRAGRRAGRLGRGDFRLPDDAFSFLFSCAVIEHVRRPWILAKEMHRVLRPGATLLDVGAFMQPFHGFPNHFYTMTESGMRVIHEDLEVLSVRPHASQHPWFALWSFLNILARGLPGVDREWITGISLAELFGELQRHVQGQPTRLGRIELPEDAIRDLAAGFTLRGRKPLT